MALGFLFWAAVAIGLAYTDELYCHIPVDLPGCDWEYHRAPVEPWKLLRWMVLGGVVHVIRIGGPLAAVGFTVRCLLLRRTGSAARSAAGGTPGGAGEDDRLSEGRNGGGKM